MGTPRSWVFGRLQRSKDSALLARSCSANQLGPNMVATVYVGTKSEGSGRFSFWASVKNNQYIGNCGISR